MKEVTQPTNQPVLHSNQLTTGKEQQQEQSFWNRSFGQQNTLHAGSESPPISGDFNLNSISIFPYKKMGIQTKLKINSPNDKYEQEADKVAEQVMRMPEPNIQRKCTSCGKEEEETIQRKPLVSQISPLVQRTCADCEEEALQTKSKGNSGRMASSTLTQQIQSSRGNGQAIDSNTQTFMATRFGHDFSGVRIHSGTQAAQMNKEINARAFTIGKDIYFNRNEYQPSSSTGKRLLAHELTHVVQQGEGNTNSAIQRSVSENYSRGNDDLSECDYETAQIFVVLDTSNFSGCDSSFDIGINYIATLKGDPTDLQPVQIGPRFSLVEDGNPSNSAQLRHTVNDPPAGPIGDTLEANLTINNVIPCEGGSIGGTVNIAAGSTVQQQIFWGITGGSSGISDESISATQLQIRGPVVPLKVIPDKYPDFPGQPRNSGNCCNSLGEEGPCSSSSTAP